MLRILISISSMTLPMFEMWDEVLAAGDEGSYGASVSFCDRVVSYSFAKRSGQAEKRRTWRVMLPPSATSPSTTAFSPFGTPLTM